MDQLKTIEQIEAYKSTKSDFADYPRFEGNVERRKAEREAFINGFEYVPNYDYPKLDFLIDDDEIVNKKREIYEAVLELEAAKKAPDANLDELELFAGFHEMRLKKIMLVEAARNLRNSISMSDADVSRESFARMNEAVYGGYDVDCYLGLLDGEKHNVMSFTPVNQLSNDIKKSLENFLGKIETEGRKESALLDELTFSKLHDYVTDKYKDVLYAVPNTPDDVYYDVNECAEIINYALSAGGLAEKGWIAVENPDKSNPATNSSSKKIFLPSNTRRNASELRRLIIHEQEVHARRNQEAKEFGVKPMIIGTANYADAEEGLALILECAVAGKLENPSFDRARNRYIAAGLALGADGCPRDAREVFEVLWRMIAIQNSKNGEINEKDVKKAKNNAYSHIENAYRGTQFWMKGVIYTKLKVYYEGLVKNADYFKENINDLDGAFSKLFIGKYDHTDPKETELVLSILRKNGVDI